MAGIPLDRPLIAEAVVTLGAVPDHPLRPALDRPSWRENVGDAICTAQALLMANHGAITVGDTLYRAWERMETVEQLAASRWSRASSGQDHLLSGRGGRGAAGRAHRGRLSAAGLRARDGGRAGPAARRIAAASADGTVTLTRRELVRLIADAVERFRRGPRPGLTRNRGSGQSACADREDEWVKRWG